MNILNALSYGGITAVIGIAIVFLGLTILIGAVSLMAAFFKKLDARKAEKARLAAEAAAREAAAAAPAPVEPEPVVEAAEEEVVTDDQLIAVIAAALAAYTDAAKPLVVRKVRRVGGWNAAARREMLERL